MTDPVTAQYEAYPYPPRDPADEYKRLITGSPSHIFEINHYIFGGKRDFSKPFRALAAGGGTGDASIMMAQQLAQENANAEVIHLDISQASIDVARARADMRNLQNIKFVQGSILDLPQLGLGVFDYIDCCGVLHHLEDPLAGLRSLEGALADGGGMGIMLYAPLGRIGVYHAQSMLKMIGAKAPAEMRLDMARRLLKGLPDTNWLRRNPFVGDHSGLGDAGLYDLLLHSRDRPFSVPEVVQLAAGAHMRVVTFIDPIRYEAGVWVKDKDLLQRVLELPPLQRWAFTEMFTGNIKKHIFYLVKAVNKTQTVASPADPHNIPILRDLDGAQLAQSTNAQDALTVNFDGLKVRFPLPPLAPQFFGLIDGQRSIQHIYDSLLALPNPPPDWQSFKTQFDSFYVALNGISRLFLRHPPTLGEEDLFGSPTTQIRV